MKAHRLKLSTLNVLHAIALLAMATPFAVQADPTTDLGTVSAQANGAAQSNAEAAKKTATTAAPTQASLKATQPQSMISQSFIEDSVSPVSDYSAIAALSPSVTGGSSSNGPGLGEAKNSMRGFQDGEFNMTFDGIPFGDTNGPTHHSTAYFPAGIIGSVVVERGPGNASNLGQATFGGSINLFSKPLAAEQTISPTYSYGSWNTQLMGLRFDSGVLDKYGDAQFALNYQKQTSDGYRTYSAVQAENYMLKAQKPFGNSTLVTLFLDHNDNWYYQPDKDNGLTAAQVAQYGKNYVLSNDPTKANYYGYNRADKNTNMDYLRLQSDLGAGWGIDDTLYYYDYDNHTLASNKGNDPTAGLSSVKLANGSTLANQMAGYIKINAYQVTGNIFKATKKLAPGLLRVGLWLEHADTQRSTYDYNLLNMTPNYDQAAVAGVYSGINNVKYDQDSGWNQYQPFAEFEWAATDRLTVTPGIKYMNTDLSIDAQVNQSSRISQHISKSFNDTLPFLTANYRLSPTWSSYFQFAKGMLVPDISYYQSNAADLSDIKPQTSTNYQLGAVHKSDRITFDADLYYINFHNKFAVSPDSPDSNDPIYYNQGGVTFKGAEAEGTYAFGNGLAVYANASYNQARSKETGLSIAYVPTNTSALGLIYKSGDWSDSLVYKRVGQQYALDDNGYQMNSYGSTDLHVSYTFKHPGLGAKTLKAQFGIYNLFNQQEVIKVKPKNTTVGSANYGLPNSGDTSLFQPERSYSVTLKAEF
jgi:iron complex outermembrane receptor protein